MPIVCITLKRATEIQTFMASVLHEKLVVVHSLPRPPGADPCEGREDKLFMKDWRVEDQNIHADRVRNPQEGRRTSKPSWLQCFMKSLSSFTHSRGRGRSWPDDPTGDAHPSSDDINYTRVKMRRHLGEFEQVLLYAVIALQASPPGACGPTIRQTIHHRTGRVISPGAIYTALDRLEQRGFVRSSLGEPTPERGGKRKRFYRLAAGGQAALKASETSLLAMKKVKA
jgi:PadR family transcriptional regulator PadR